MFLQQYAPFFHHSESGFCFVEFARGNCVSIAFTSPGKFQDFLSV